MKNGNKIDPIEFIIHNHKEIHSLRADINGLLGMIPKIVVSQIQEIKEAQNKILDLFIELSTELDRITKFRYGSHLQYMNRIEEIRKLIV